MSWRTVAPVVWARSIGRALGINRAIMSVLPKRAYEAAYDEGLSAMVRVGDCVWDVGANVGRYTKPFSAAVGKSGTVWAFEPSPINATILRRTCASLANVRVMELALGRENGRLSFRQGQDDLGATSRVLMDGSGPQEVDMRCGLALVEEGAVPAPNVIKIDVEGFELEVLEGLGHRLHAQDLRAIGVEVHFGILAERGMASAPGLIERLLREHDFSITWPDGSHLLAIRSRE